MIVSFLKKLVDEKSGEVKLKSISKTNEEYISVTYGCIKLIDRYRFLSSSTEELVETLEEDDFKNLKKRFSDHWEVLYTKLAYPIEFFIKIEDYKKPVASLKKGDFFSKLKKLVQMILK